MLSFIKREPVAFATSLLVILAALFGVLASFDLKLTADQQAAITGLLTAVLGLWTRAQVSPNSTPKDPPSGVDRDALPPPPSTKPSGFPRPAAFAGFGLLVLACAGMQPEETAPCRTADYGVLAATCGDDVEICNEMIGEREKFCADRIRSGR
jgi:hypothetical protein